MSQLIARGPATFKLKYYPGLPGPANSLTIGTVTTGEIGGSAAASITGTSPNQVLNLTIPLPPTGTTAGTVAAGDDSRITGAAQKSANLSDLASASTARTNLGLGSMATQAASSVAITGGTINNVAIGSAATGTTPVVDTNTTALATAAFVIGQAASATPVVDGVAAVGTSTRFARADHVHPTDTSRVPTTRTLTAGTGLSGGGDLSADRTVSLATISTGNLLANFSGSTAAPSATTLTSALDSAVGNARGTIAVRGASSWTALALGTNGYTLQSNGTDAVWAATSPGTGAVRYDTSQSLTSGERLQARTNTGVTNGEFAGSATVASASTTDLNANAAVCQSVSGTTNITSFGTGTNLFRLIRFSGSLTLTHNSTSLILPGGKNIDTAAGDTALATSDSSGNWTVRDYTRANGVLPLGALSTWTPTITPTGGALGSLGTVIANYQRITDRLVYFELTIPMPNKGTAAGVLQVTLPFTAASNGAAFGGELALTGAALTALITGSNNVLSLFKYDGTFPGNSGSTFVVAGIYETT